VHLFVQLSPRFYIGLRYWPRYVEDALLLFAKALVETWEVLYRKLASFVQIWHWVHLYADNIRLLHLIKKVLALAVEVPPGIWTSNGLAE